MFTGLIQALGTIRRIGSEQVQISCTSDWILKDLMIGDSVAVDGVCLTVETLLSDGFVAAASPETLRRTTLEQQLDTGYVNLETSLRVGSKLGGHFVTGHVDGVGYLQSAVQTASSWEMSFTVNDARIARYIVPKGSIAINGVSLTVADCDATGTWFKAAVIPLTFAETNLQYLRPGSGVNLEGDVLGKYVEKFLRLKDRQDVGQGIEIGTRSADGDGAAIAEGWESITPAFLAEHGYL